MLANLLAGLDKTQGFAIIVVCVLVSGTIVAIMAMLVAQAQARKALVEADLKRRMIERGMSAHEIAKVLGKDEVEEAENLACASEAVVEWEGDWYPSYVLKTAPGRFFVHYIGHDVSENEWVEAHRVRLPAATDRD